MAPSVRDLTGYGKGKRCAIVGGGLSLRGFPWGRLRPGITVFSCNLHAWRLAHYVIYHDKDIGDEIIRLGGWEHRTIIGPDVWWKEGHHAAIKTAFTYSTTSDIDFGDTGYHALQIADGIMHFDEVYLIGLDYSANAETYHHDEDKSDSYMLEKFLAHSVGRVLAKVNAYKPRGRVFIGTPSAITAFPARSPLDEAGADRL